MSAQPIMLTDQEIKDLTGYCRPAYQMKVLKSLGIPVRRRPDNTLIVLRMDCTARNAQPANEPKLNFA
jgi:hypothetical protein